jgi:hypothetical protein
MKNPVEMLKEIKNLLGVELTEQKSEVILAQLKLENGTILESEDFNVGKEVFILTEDEKVALPIGNYELEDGRNLEITEEGVINSIEVKAEESPEEVEDEVKEDEEEMNEEKYPTRDEFDALKEMVESMKEKMGKDYDEKKEDKKMEEEEELKAELSKPASEPIKHNPEQKATKKVLYAQNRSNNTLDIVMGKILNKQ